MHWFPQLGLADCEQVPADYPDFAAFLVANGIDSISLSADALVETLRTIVAIETGEPDARRLSAPASVTAPSVA